MTLMLENVLWKCSFNALRPRDKLMVYGQKWEVENYREKNKFTQQV